MNEQRNEYDAVRHLVELGYTDPDEVALREAAVRRRLEAEVQEAINANKQGRVGEAVALLQRLEVDNPDWIAPHELLVEIHYQAGRWGEAESELKWLEHHAIEHPRLSLMAAGIALLRRDLAAALELLDYAGHVEPTLAGVNTLLGTARFRLGQHEAAIEAFERALQQNPADASALDGLAAIYLHRREYERAAGFALEALEHDMQLYRAHYHLGVALAHMNRPQEATAALDAASRLAPVSAAPFYWLARIAEVQTGDAARAEEYRHRARATIRRRRTGTISG